jgi:polysaccharide export outer membrane protein
MWPRSRFPHMLYGAPGGKGLRRLKVLTYGLPPFLFYLIGCASYTHILPPTEKPTTALPRVDKLSAVSGSDLQEKLEKDNIERLSSLWYERSQNDLVTDYPIAPGDILAISVHAIEELKDHVVRVSGEGTISLPYIGNVQAQGLSEVELRAQLAQRLGAYMRHPQVALFVREHRSRQVAVLGAVAKPGLYTLASGADTLLTMISLAGGMREDAAQRIVFIPAEPVDDKQARQLAANLPAQLASINTPYLILKGTDPLLIDLNHLSQGAPQLYLTLPARPGDVIMVPGGGEVLVDGWVAKPGSYKITPGLTVSGVVTAAGGPLFAADTSEVRVIRWVQQRGKTVLPIDLGKVKRGEAADIPVREGDVIEVSAAASKLVPYAFYRFFSAILSVGVDASLPVR